MSGTYDHPFGFKVFRPDPVTQGYIPACMVPLTIVPITDDFIFISSVATMLRWRMTGRSQFKRHW